MQIIKDYEMYKNHKIQLWQKYYTYVWYWNKIIWWKTKEEMINDVYLNYSEEYREYKKKSIIPRTYAYYMKHRKRKSMQELIDENNIEHKGKKKYAYSNDKVIKSIQENRMKQKIQELTWFYILPRNIEESKIFNEEDYKRIKICNSWIN